MKLDMELIPGRDPLDASPDESTDAFDLAVMVQGFFRAQDRGQPFPRAALEGLAARIMARELGISTFNPGWPAPTPDAIAALRSDLDALPAAYSAAMGAVVPVAPCSVTGDGS